MEKALVHVQDIRRYLDAELLEELKNVVQPYVEDIEAFEQAILGHHNNLGEVTDRQMFIRKELLPICSIVPSLLSWKNKVCMAYRAFYSVRYRFVISLVPRGRCIQGTLFS